MHLYKCDICSVQCHVPHFRWRKDVWNWCWTQRHIPDVRCSGQSWQNRPHCGHTLGKWEQWSSRYRTDLHWKTSRLQSGCREPASPNRYRLGLYRFSTISLPDSLLFLVQYNAWRPSSESDRYHSGSLHWHNSWFCLIFQIRWRCIPVGSCFRKSHHTSHLVYNSKFRLNTPVWRSDSAGSWFQSDSLPEVRYILDSLDLRSLRQTKSYWHTHTLLRLRLHCKPLNCIKPCTSFHNILRANWWHHN